MIPVKIRLLEKLSLMYQRVYLKYLPVWLLLIVFACLMGGHLIPLHIKSVLFSISLSIKEVLIFVLPLVIFSYLYSSIFNFQSGALRFILVLIPMVFLSNLVATLSAFLIGIAATNGAPIVTQLTSSTTQLPAAWSYDLPNIMTNGTALLFGLLAGIIMFYFQPNRGRRLAQILIQSASKLLNVTIVPLMPLFILGFTLKLQHEGTLTVIMRDYIKIFGLVAGVQFAYVFAILMLLMNLNVLRFWSAVKNILPALITGFSTMSSAVAMPFTLGAAEKITGNQGLARAVVPATTNIHLLGDCFCVPIFAMAILSSFGMEAPGMMKLLYLTAYFTVARFGVAGVPGGGILVMLPILENHLGFSGEMLSLITALYVMFDPLVTMANVSGNSTFAVLVNRLFEKTPRLFGSAAKAIG